MPNYEFLLYDVSDQVCTITFNRPDKRNALNTKLLEELDNALDVAEADNDVRVVLFKGAGTAFSAGYDLRDNPYTTPPAGQDHWRLNDASPALRKISDRYLRIWYYSKPTVAQVQGPAIATGCYFQMLCDIAFAADTATFGHQAQRVGGVTSLPLWVWMLGLRQAKYLLLTGRLITAKEAQKIGLVTRVFPAEELEDEVTRLCQDLTKSNPLGVTWLKDAINADYDMMGLRASFPLHHSMNAAYRVLEQEPGQLSLADIVFGGDRQEVPEGEV
ncbi:MAG TPA: enoyl-CoA hydratase-related protein [Pseudomonadales bacterium]|jgi:enoyl-CoA hydratase|nr:enoyl-CoA hydratase-related protein [Pseudomonadales bacterium]MDP6314801.1 enoyl-CoA hydratase-related protein [Pseudomonadales bacterium]MDP7315439.1 enoyl-CoA hydratase-related protein [Pseudomonadales bacterium]MDP7450894.1 enoyl-CoA hydratase-related protein [Arenicellales bacterium]HJP51077.1 enoyl-CoA hydratase-related protein [Pseudomonadales bacterium]|tara:strand:+ start:706 stop:1524 length:819 start_codon:yes stop_codon:yes gene_type:complete